MKNFSYLFMAGLMTLGFWACSDDAEVTPGGDKENTADKVYMSFKLELPTASRSTTDEDTGDTNSNATPDSEVGTEKENNVSHVDVVLATRNGNEYVYKVQSTDAVLGGAGSNYVATFNATDLTSTVADQNVHVFVFCNYPYGTVGRDIFTKSINVTSFTDEIAKDDNFWMANAVVSEAKLIPSTFEAYNSPSNPFELPDVKVERAAARFDFKHKEAVGGLEQNEYLLSTGTDPKVTVKLTNMALVNISNSFNILRRVAGDSNSDNIAEYNSAIICDVETPTNYVVDSDAADKVTYNYLPNNFLNYWDGTTPNANTGKAERATGNMNFGDLWTNKLINAEKTLISSLTVDDKWAGTGSTGNGDYKVWRYATENTLPSINSQKKSLSTAVLFRGELKVEDDRLSGETAYVYNNILYGQWSQVQTASISEPNLKAAYDAAMATVTAPATEPSLENAAAVGFTVYTPEVTGANKCWPVYYYYINKHNDNDDDSLMGPMELAVVRNNVYKLSVTEINKFGHPGNPGGDPDPVDPNDPDESKNVYFKVAVKVLPWTVRVNNIIF